MTVSEEDVDKIVEAQAKGDKATILKILNNDSETRFNDRDTERIAKALGIIKEPTNNRYSWIPPEPKKKGRYDR